MLRAKIYQDDDVDRRLSSFGITKKELVDVVRNTAFERSTSVPPVDPLSAAGQLSYIAGTRHLRLLLMPKGYRIDREQNVESSIHDGLGIKIAYQNVDQACAILRPPRAISGKRSASAKMIDDAQGSLFGGEDLPAVVDVSKLRRLQSSVWYLCTSFDEDGEICAELSLPAAVRKGNFSGFFERIFLIERGELTGFVMPDITDRVEAEPLIARR